jgi:hypothetical protein
MRHFEIAKRPARHILTNAEQRDAAREPRSGKIKTAGERGMKSVGSRQTRAFVLESLSRIKRQSRRRHL